MKTNGIKNPDIGPGSTIDRIQKLVDKGVLGRELCPERAYWHWNILKPGEIPADLAQTVYDGEVRWYGEA